MEYNDKLFDDYFSYDRISKKQRDFCLNVMRNSKEVTNSTLGNKKFDIERMQFCSCNKNNTKTIL